MEPPVPLTSSPSGYQKGLPASLPAPTPSPLPAPRTDGVPTLVGLSGKPPGPAPCWRRGWAVGALETARMCMGAAGGAGSGWGPASHDTEGVGWQGSGGDPRLGNRCTQRRPRQDTQRRAAVAALEVGRWDPHPHPAPPHRPLGRKGGGGGTAGPRPWSCRVGPRGQQLPPAAPRVG